ncbi:putative six-hairpin glycosidase [Erysiphe necator]|uniref:mannan endo-1,6-alpha-mannosidase n=1 Tax=Uncinula necator TaxID=52586 RepID=A0A0B1P5E5_UNCNE|nr:putative six-hairpin glycosidase [Erysiphe necator]
MILSFLPIFYFFIACLALNLDVTNDTSIKNAASTIAYSMMKYYTGNVSNTESTIAVLPPPYYWWESGAMWGAMLDYQHYTGDLSYAQVVSQALSSQRGPKNDFMAPLHTKDEGNDDQAFWGFATMSAAEKNFPYPGSGITWIGLTENLWNTQVGRWDISSCGGGLRWQIFDFNKGYDYKNTVSNAAFFQLSARLARFTGNQTYADWANKSYDWMVQMKLIDPEYRVFDGIDSNQCHDINQLEWTYNHAIIIYGAAVMQNHTNASPIWVERVQGFLEKTTSFFGPEVIPKVMFEPICETQSSCNTDQQSFKAYLSRFLWASTIMAPSISEKITHLLTTSAKAAAISCSGGSDGKICGEKWYVDGYDGSNGVGEYMAALEIIQGLLVKKSIAPLRGINIDKNHVTPSLATISFSKTGATSLDIGQTDIPSAPKPLHTLSSGLTENKGDNKPSSSQSMASSVVITSTLGAPSNDNEKSKSVALSKPGEIARLDDSSISVTFAPIPRVDTLSYHFVVVIMAIVQAWIM